METAALLHHTSSWGSQRTCDPRHQQTTSTHDLSLLMVMMFLLCSEGVYRHIYIFNGIMKVLTKLLPEKWILKIVHIK